MFGIKISRIGGGVMKNLIVLSVLALLLALVAVTPVMAQTSNTPCVLAALDRPSFVEGEQVKVMVMSLTECLSRPPTKNSKGVLGQRVGLTLAKLVTEETVLVPYKGAITPSATIGPPVVTRWQQVDFRESFLVAGRGMYQDDASFSKLSPGRYRIGVTTLDDSGYDYIRSLLFDVQGWESKHLRFIADPKEPIEEYQPDPDVYLRPGFTQVDEKQRFLFGSEIGGARASGFLFQIDYRNLGISGGAVWGMATVLPTEFQTIGKMGDVSLVRTVEPFSPDSPWSSSIPILACVQPDSGSSLVCGRVYDPKFPTKNWGTYVGIPNLPIL